MLIIIKAPTLVSPGCGPGGRGRGGPLLLGDVCWQNAGPCRAYEV